MIDAALSAPLHSAPTRERFPPGVVVAPTALPLLCLRALELESGALHDVSKRARAVGFVWPVAVTHNLWEAISTLPPAYAHEAVLARLWDVLSMARVALRQGGSDTKGGRERRYNLVLHTHEHRALYTVRLVVEAGEDSLPALTLSSADNDRQVALGAIFITPGAREALVTAQVSPALVLLRHRRADWGDMDACAWKVNDRALMEGTPLLSAYALEATGVIVWLLTAGDRSHSILLLPSEY